MMERDRSYLVMKNKKRLSPYSTFSCIQICCFQCPIDCRLVQQVTISPNILPRTLSVGGGEVLTDCDTNSDNMTLNYVLLGQSFVSMGLH